MPLGASFTIQTDFSVDSADTDTGTLASIYGASSNPGGLTGDLTSTAWAATKSYTFDPTVPGTYIFYAQEESTYYPVRTTYATYTVTVTSTAPSLSITATDYNGTATANSVVVPVGGNTTIGWTATNVAPSSCEVQKWSSVSNSTSTINSGNANDVWSDGPFTSAGTRVYTLSCNDTNGNPVTPVAVTVNITGCTTGTGTAPNSCSNSCALDESSTNAPATISWCCPSGTTGSGFSTGGTAQGSVSGLGAGTYGIECEAGGASLAVASTPSLPTITSFTATRVKSGAPSTLSWNIDGMASGITCSIAPSSQLPGQGAMVWDSVNPWQSSTTTVSITKTTVFTLSCTNGSNTTTANATATLVPAFQEI